MKRQTEIYLEVFVFPLHLAEKPMKTKEKALCLLDCLWGEAMSYNHIGLHVDICISTYTYIYIA